MNHRRFALVTFWVLSQLVATGSVQPAPSAAPPGPAPLLYLRLQGPAGSRFTVYYGMPEGASLPAPVSLAVRPGYVYRFKLTDIPKHPGVALYPTVEVHGTLHLPPGGQAALHPAPVSFSESDIDQVLAGAFITKVVVLEHPERAAPIATELGQALETDLRPHEDPVAHARVLGRPVLIVRLGGRTLPPDDLAAHAVANTILLPGGRALGQPAVPPHLSWECHDLFDPRLGRRPPEEECMHDGGDAGRPVGLDHQGRLQGLDPADTVAEYSDSKGQRRIAISNRVCVCVPRFVVLRIQIVPTAYDSVRIPGEMGIAQVHAQVRERIPSLELLQREHVNAMRGRQQPSAAVHGVGPVSLDHITGSAIIVAEREGQEISATVARELPELPDRPLLLVKWTDCATVQIGDVVTFHLRYTNTGGKPISNVVVSDSLTGRLEYVPGSARTDRQAVFTTQLNEAGSLTLRWEIGGLLLPGQSGMVSFQVRIR
jgi:uncharacterized repeat protein (TIGR01451 family)